MGQIKGNSIDGLKLGMLMRASWEPVRLQYGENVYGLKFEPLS